MEISLDNTERSGLSPTRSSYTLPRCPAGGGPTCEYVGKVPPEVLADEVGVPEN
jgi:hypothetical protein